MKSAAESRRLFWAVALVLVVADFATKRIAEQALLPYPPIAVIGEWVQLRLVYNQGAAFGLHLGPWSRWIFLAVAVLAIVLLYRLARSSPARDWMRQVSCALVAGGAAGNLVDRVRGTQGVVDFIDIGVGATRWPTFNVADMGVSLGAIALALSLWIEDARRSRTHTAPSA
jgi:signal peptidase II